MAILSADPISAGLARSGEIRFEPASGLDELRAEWPNLRRVRLWGRGAAPADLVSVVRMILPYQGGRRSANAPTDLVSVVRMILHCQAQRRGKTAPPTLCRWSADSALLAQARNHAAPPTQGRRGRIRDLFRGSSAESPAPPNQGRRERSLPQSQTISQETGNRIVTANNPPHRPACRPAQSRLDSRRACRASARHNRLHLGENQSIPREPSAAAYQPARDTGIIWQGLAPTGRTAWTPLLVLPVDP